jgi:hypothetical protein
MRSFVNFVGIVLIIVGIVALAYQGFTYTKKEKIADIMSIEVTADTQKTVYLSPILAAFLLYLDW